ncbi:MAG: NAD-dependent epimerase/dehydratase family protein [Bacteriovoracia bacterium]
MSVAIVTGSSGLIGSESVRYFHEKGFDVVGIDNDMRKYFFGEQASTSWNKKKLEKQCPRFKQFDIDIRSQEAVNALFREFKRDIKVVIHTAAQPSHDWAAKEPQTDFSVNANGTLNLLEAARQYCLDAPFIFTSTNKVYGDTPNQLPLVEKEKRWELAPSHGYAENGIDENMSIDQSKHSLFGCSKVAADILCQEYGRYFGLRTGIFRGGCLTGPAHSGAELHGFLAYLVKSAASGTPYTVFGYKGKQVRDNIHSFDLVNAFWHFFEKPRVGEVYNIGGSRHSNCSMLEAIELIEKLGGGKLNYQIVDKAREGDHIWWISDVRKFQQHYPQWVYKYGIKEILQEMVEVAKNK